MYFKPTPVNECASQIISANFISFLPITCYISNQVHSYQYCVDSTNATETDCQRFALQI